MAIRPSLSAIAGTPSGDTARTTGTTLAIKPAPSFRFYVSEAEVQLVGGKPLLLPIAVPVVTGAQNVPDNGDPAMLDAYQMSTLRRTVVPLDFECLAWGKKVTGYRCALEIGRDATGQPITHYHDVWHRYLQAGPHVIAEFDREGWLDFCRRCQALVPEIHPITVSAERERLGQLANDHQRMGHASPAAAHEAEVLRQAAAPAA